MPVEGQALPLALQRVPQRPLREGERADAKRAVPAYLRGQPSQETFYEGPAGRFSHINFRGRDAVPGKEMLMKIRLTAVLLAAMIMTAPLPCMAGEVEGPIDQDPQEEQALEEDAPGEEAPAEEGVLPAEDAMAGGTGEGLPAAELPEEVLEEELPELASGWKETAKGTLYYVSGRPVTGWKTIGGRTYYFGNDGLMRTLWQTINGFRYYFGTDGAQATGFRTINGCRYYFYPRTQNKKYKGTMAKNWVTINKKTYYFAADGAMRTGWQTLNGCRYYFGTDGVQRLGLQKVGGDTYYFYKSTIKKYKGHYKGAAATGVVESGNKYYYMQKSGKDKYKAYKGIHYFGSADDKLEGSGFTYYVGHNFVYFNQDGSLYDGLDEEIIKVGSGRYYHLGYGLLTTGFKKVDGKIYYFDKDTARMKTGWVWASDSEGSVMDGKYAGFESTRRTEAWWYFGSDGAFQPKKGWQTIGGRKFYFGSYKDSVYGIRDMYFDYPMMLAGQARVGGKYYIFNTKDGMQTGWINGDDIRPGRACNGGGKGSKYYAGSDGVVKTGWQKIGGRTYYFAPSANDKGYVGQLLTGSNIYKASKSGLSYMFEMKYYKKVNGTDQYKVRIGNAWYVINKDGSLVKKL